ncbi:MAG: DUF4417 domain-containing protein [Veillonellaceae bacterium]|nr:DUF4417 domain-containing protein [Veillonellaceae bacterium]
MTSYEIRNNPLFLRNAYFSDNIWDIPCIEKQDLSLQHVSLIAYSATKARDSAENYQKGVHFFLDDYRFRRVYTHPAESLGRIAKYAFALTPDSSTYTNMPRWRIMESVAHSRWCGAYWQSEGLLVVPTVSWANPNTYDLCFAGLPRGGVVAVSTLGCKAAKGAFLAGYQEMLRRLQPRAIICFGRPFAEMGGQLLVVDYISPCKGVA